MWRQGDVLIEQVSEIPEAVVLQKRMVVASGDTSGHSHKIKDRRTARLYASTEPSSLNLYLEVTEASAELVHPEHAAIKLSKGCYRVWKQREFVDHGSRAILD